MTNKMNYNKLLDLFLDFGETMMSAGAEINRVEDTISRMGRAYGAVKTNVFVITSSIVITMTFSDSTEITQTRRILSYGNTDFVKLEALNALSRRCCEKVLTVSEFEKEINGIKTKSANMLKLYLGSIFAAGGFAVFFGGTLADGVVASVFAVLICFLQIKAAPVFPNKVFFCFFCALVCGFGICIAAKFLPFLNSDKIMIGDIMLLIPGIAITNAVRDMFIGDTISGTMKLTESLIWAGALACGFIIAIVTMI